MAAPAHDPSPRILEANLRALRRTSPAAAAVLAQWAGGSNPCGVKARLIDTPSGFPSLELAGGGLLHSRYDPVREAEAWAARAPSADGVVVVYGFGLGYHVEALLRDPRVVRVVVIEPEPAAACVALGARRLEGLLRNPRFQLLFTEPREQLHIELDTAVLSGVVAGGWTFQAFPPYRRLYAQQIEELQRWLVDTVRNHRGNVAIYHFWFEPWIVNVIPNLRYLVGRPFVNQWFGVWQGIPAILVAAGPSVTPNLPLLERLKGRVPIVAAGSGLGPLVEAGIQPDLVVSIDAGVPNYRHFQGRRLTAPLAFGPEIYPRILEEYGGPLIPMATLGGTSFPLVCQLAGFDPPALPSGPSVANVTLALLHALGADPVILVGQDLAFPGGRSHADGVPTATGIDPGSDGIEWVEAVGGGKVPTYPSMQLMRHWFEQYLAAAGERTVVNTSPAGARIRGTQEMSLAEAVSRFGLDRDTGLTGVFSGPPPADGRNPPAIMKADLETLLRRIVDEIAAARHALERAAAAGRRALAMLAGPTAGTSRAQAALADFERHRLRLEKTKAYRHFLQQVMNYRRLALAQVRHQPALWLKRYLEAYRTMDKALETLRAAAQQELGAL